MNKDPKLQPMSNAQTRYDVNDIIRKLYIGEPFFGSLLSRFRIKVSNAIPTLGVSPKREMLVNPLFWTRWCLLSGDHESLI